MNKIFLLLTFFLVPFLGQSQDKSNRGKEFWMSYGYDYTFNNEPPINSQELAIYISTIQAATVTVSVTNTGFSQTLTIPANTVDASILIPKSGANDARTLTDGLQSRGIHIVSDVPVAAYAHVYATQVSGATMLMPVETYGNKYYSVNYYQNTSNSTLPAISATTANGNDWYSWFYVVAAENNTRIEVTPSDSTKNGWLPGQTYTVDLNKGESYHVFGKLLNGSSQAWAASKDMTGSKVLSVAGSDGKCHPVAMFSGSGGIRMCRGDGGEFMQQQVFPAQAWGTRYLTYHTINNANTDINETNRNYYRICVQDPSSVVKRNGVALTGMIKNFFYEIMDSTGGDYITSDKPILVAQYTPNKNQCWRFPTTSPSPPSYGDPEMFFLSPIEQGQKSVLFYTSRKSSIDYVYVNIHIPTAAVTSLLVDGATVPSANVVSHPNLPGYSVALARFVGPSAQHRISSDSNFTATVYGLGNYESYGYNVGTLINNLNAIPLINNTLNSNGRPDTFTCPKSPFRLTVKVAYRATSLKWILSQTGGGLAPNTDSLIMNPIPIDSNLVNGRRYYTYTLLQNFIFATAGVYEVPVIYTSPDIDNCDHSDTAKIQLVVKPGPVSDFTFNNVNCIQDTARYTGAAIAGSYILDRFIWTFDDNTTVNAVNATKKYTVGGSHNVTYRVIADNGCLADTVKAHLFLGSPISKFGFDRNICVGDSIKFSDSTTIAQGTVATWKWNFGDGNSLIRTNNSSFYHPYTVAGTYLVSLVAASASGCESDTFRLAVSVSFKPVPKFGILVNNICLGDSIRISDSSSIAQGNITGWYWNFGDGSTTVNTNGNPFYHPYTASGNYVVSLVVASANGCSSDTFTVPVSVGVKPMAKFGLDNTIICVRDSVRMIDSSTVTSGTIAQWKWNFGDGTSITKLNNNTFYHPYSLSGTYTISLVTVPAVGCVSDTFKRTITVNNKPIAKFGFDRNICVGDSIKFSDSSVYLGGNITNRQWSFGDGNTVNKNNNSPFYHTYIMPGNYSVTLVVTPNIGCTDTFRLTVNVAQKPIASFTVGGALCKDSIVTFTPISVANGGTIQSWFWDFGNGQIRNATTATAVTAAYPAVSNTIVVKHVVGIGGGCFSDTAFMPLIIHSNPTADFSIIGDTLCENTLLQFLSIQNPTDSISNWVWNFGDGSFGNLDVVNKKYAQAGSYNVMLRLKDRFGCGSLPVTKPVTIKKMPVVDAGPSFAVFSGSTVVFNPTVNDSLLFTFRWTPTFTGLSNPDSLRPTLMVLQNQTYTLTAMGAGNCTAEDTLQVKVLSALRTVNAFSPNGDGINDVWILPGLEDYLQATVQIFDRYGRVVYTSTGSPKPWDGKLNGTVLPVGTYYYIIDTKTDFVKPFTGAVTILK